MSLPQKPSCFRPRVFCIPRNFDLFCDQTPLRLVAFVSFTSYRIRPSKGVKQYHSKETKVCANSLFKQRLLAVVNGASLHNLSSPNIHIHRTPCVSRATLGSLNLLAMATIRAKSLTLTNSSCKPRWILDSMSRTQCPISPLDHHPPLPKWDPLIHIRFLFWPSILHF